VSATKKKRNRRAGGCYIAAHSRNLQYFPGMENLYNSLLEGIYFHAITFSDVKPAMTSTWIAVIYLSPIFLWLMSLVFAVLMLSPKAYMININSSSASKETFEEIVSKKHGMIKVSETFLIISFVALKVAMGHYLLEVSGGGSP